MRPDKKNSTTSSLRRKGILAPLRMGGANIAPDVTDGVFPCEVGAAPQVGTVHRRWFMKG
jgi:hypothetical protein